MKKVLFLLVFLGVCTLLSLSFSVSHPRLYTDGVPNDSITNVFVNFLKHHQPKYTNAKLEDLLVKKYSADSMEKLVDEYHKRLPFYPDEMYCLLLEHFEPIPKLDSIRMDGARLIMSYRHKFKNGVEFQYTELESGGEIWCLFPTQNVKQVKTFIYNLYNTHQKHAWDSDTTFSPVEYDAGCFGNLKVNETTVELSMYCGC